MSQLSYDDSRLLVVPEGSPLLLHLCVRLQLQYISHDEEGTGETAPCNRFTYLVLQLLALNQAKGVTSRCPCPSTYLRKLRSAELQGFA